MIPSKQEALAVVQENNDIDSAKYERKIESLLMMWMGTGECCLDVPGVDGYLVPHLMKLLKEAGYIVRSMQRSNAAADWKVFFK